MLHFASIADADSRMSFVAGVSHIRRVCRRDSISVKGDIACHQDLSDEEWVFDCWKNWPLFQPPVTHQECDYLMADNSLRWI